MMRKIFVLIGLALIGINLVGCKSKEDNNLKEEIVENNTLNEKGLVENNTLNEKESIIVLEDNTLAKLFNIPNIAKSDIKKVKSKVYRISCAPGPINDVLESIDDIDIDNVFNLFYSTVTPDLEYPIKFGCRKTEYIISTTDNEYTVSVFDDHVYFNNTYYKITNASYDLINNSNYEAKFFLTYQKEYSAYKLDNTKIGDYNNLEEYEFVRANNNLEDNVMEPLGYLITDIGTIKVIDYNTFSITNGNTYFYRITGEKNFSSIFKNM